MEYDWVHNPYAVSPEPTTNFPLEKEELAELQSDRTLQLKYGELSLLKFWVLAKDEYPEIAVEAVNTLLHLLLTTYLCERGFPALTNIMNKKCDFSHLNKKCMCVCSQFDHELNFCVRNDKLKFLTNYSTL
jgi:Na+-transporting NADH:ubiquinone oxidoreductase subunit NqrF